LPSLSSFVFEERYRPESAGVESLERSFRGRVSPPMEHYRGRPIFWGLGNFVWPNFSPEGSITAVAEVTVQPTGRARGRLLPAFIEASGHPVPGD
jgi:hypothetical protein